MVTRINADTDRQRVNARFKIRPEEFQHKSGDPSLGALGLAQVFTPVKYDRLSYS